MSYDKRYSNCSHGITNLGLPSWLPFSTGTWGAGWKIQLLQFDYKELRYNVSRLPEEFVLTCPYSQFALFATNAVRVAPIDVSKSGLFLHLLREIVTAISRWSKIFVFEHTDIPLRADLRHLLFLFEEWGMRSSKARVGSWVLSKWGQTQNENAFKIRTHSKWEFLKTSYGHGH